MTRWIYQLTKAHESKLLAASTGGERVKKKATQNYQSLKMLSIEIIKKGFL